MPRAILIRPIHMFECEIIDFESDGTGSTLNWMYFHIQCRTVTCVRPFPHSPLARFDDIDFWGDDEGLMVNDPQLNGTAMILSGYPGVLVGNWLLTRRTPGGDTIALTDEQIDEITKILTPIPGASTAG